MELVGSIHMWWLELPEEEKLEYRELTLTATELRDGEMMIVTYDGGKFIPIILSADGLSRRGKGVPEPDGRLDDWWWGSSRQVRTWAHRMGMLAFELLDGQDKSVRVKKSGGSLSIELAWGEFGTN